MTTYTRRAYEDTAALLSTEPRSATLCDKFADLFASDNDRFDRARFLRACGVMGDDKNDAQELARRNLEKVARRNAGFSEARQ